ncbi:MAG: molybdenum cofactor biosynthesis protein MoaE [Bdellovibrionales bacterium]|nr:molybdenum cofactor biosynthesis protein MoaE [Bdellovibrionales bacterium]
MDQVLVEIREGAIVRSQVLDCCGDPAHGAQAYFFGAVRDRNEGKFVRGVEYECYETLARKTLELIAKEAVANWGPIKVFVCHAKGYLQIGDVSVAIAVSSPHRAEAFEACRYVIEEIKKRAPIWKQEHYEDGKSEWIKGHTLCSHTRAIPWHHFVGRKIQPDGCGQNHA